MLVIPVSTSLVHWLFRFCFSSLRRAFFCSFVLYGIRVEPSVNWQHRVRYIFYFVSVMRSSQNIVWLCDWVRPNILVNSWLCDWVRSKAVADSNRITRLPAKSFTQLFNKCGSLRISVGWTKWPRNPTLTGHFQPQTEFFLLFVVMRLSQQSACIAIA